MGLLSFNAKPIDPTEKKKPKHNAGKMSVKSNKTGAARKRDLADYTAYGDTLFEKAWRPAKEIVVSFYPFTTNQIRVSRDGRFAIEYILVAGEYQSTLFEFTPPIEYEYKFEEFKIDELEYKYFGPFFDLEKLKNQLIKIIRDEHLAIMALEKEAAIKKKEEEEQLRKKSIEEAEKLSEQIEVALPLPADKEQL